MILNGTKSRGVFFSYHVIPLSIQSQIHFIAAIFVIFKYTKFFKHIPNSWTFFATGFCPEAAVLLPKRYVLMLWLLFVWLCGCYLFCKCVY